MIKQQEKSVCCNALIIRFGGKRRQCTKCAKTWRIKPAKRGRKAKRQQINYLNQVFGKGFLVKQIDTNSRLTIDSIYKRFHINLDKMILRKRNIFVKGSKLILIIDAQWHYFNRELWTLYFISVKSSNANFVTVLDPVLKQGKESATGWKQLFDDLPTSIKKRVIAIVSDGIRGIETVTNNQGWILQRCHFHILSRLQGMRGKRLSTLGRIVRDDIYCSVRATLTETSETKLKTLCDKLLFLSKDIYCPKRMRMIVREFIRRISEFRSYLNYANLNLPNTSNVMESINSYVKKRGKTVKNPQSWHKWAIACVRFKSKFTCK